MTAFLSTPLSVGKGPTETTRVPLPKIVLPSLLVISLVMAHRTFTPLTLLRWYCAQLERRALKPNTDDDKTWH